MLNDFFENAGTKRQFHCFIIDGDVVALTRRDLAGVSLASSRPFRRVLKARAYFGVGRAPFLKLFDDVGIHAGGREQLRVFPYVVAGDVFVTRRRSIRVLGYAAPEISSHCELRVLLQPSRQKRLCDGAPRLTGKRLEHRCPRLANHDRRADILVGTPPLRGVFRSDAWIRRLQRLDHGNQKSRRFGSSAFAIQVLELANHIDPVHGSAVAVPVVAIVEEHLQLIPRRVEVLVGQRSASHPRRTIRDIDRSWSRRSRNYIEPSPCFAGRPKQFAATSFKTKLLSHLPSLHQLPELCGIRFQRQIGRPTYVSALYVRFEKLAPGVPPFIEVRDDATW